MWTLLKWQSNMDHLNDQQPPLPRMCSPASPPRVAIDEYLQLMLSDTTSEDADTACAAIFMASRSVAAIEGTVVCLQVYNDKYVFTLDSAKQLQCSVKVKV